MQQTPPEDEELEKMAISGTIKPQIPKDHVLPPIGEVVPQIHDKLPPLSSSLGQAFSQRLPLSPTGPSQHSTPSSLNTSPTTLSFPHHSATSSSSSYDVGSHGPRPADVRFELKLPQLSSSTKRPHDFHSSDRSARRMSLASAGSSASLGDANKASPLHSASDDCATSPGLSYHDDGHLQRGPLPSLFSSSSTSSSDYFSRPRPSTYDSRYEQSRTYPPSGRSFEPLSPISQISPYYQQDYPSQRRLSYSSHGSMGLDRPPYHGQHANYETLGIHGENRGRRRRGNLPKQVTDLLRSWFHEHLSHPYPSEEEKQELMQRTGLTMSQVSNWFINARRRQLPGLKDAARAENEGRGY